MAEILSGGPVAQTIYEQIRTAVSSMETAPRMALFIVGNDPASEFYVQNIAKRGKKVGIAVDLQRYPADTPVSALCEALDRANADPATRGIMVQRPLPGDYDEAELLSRIDPRKDIDAVTAESMGRLLLQRPGFIPCTAEAVLRLCEYYGIATSGKHVVVLGRSAVIGRPLANLLLRKGLQGDATVTVCHRQTTNLREITREADILVAAIGQAEFVKADMVRKNAVVIDVGVNLKQGVNSEESYVGDVDYVNVSDRVSAITPVPGGVGTVTTAVLLSHVLQDIK